MSFCISTTGRMKIVMDNYREAKISAVINTYVNCSLYSYSVRVVHRYTLIVKLLIECCFKYMVWCVGAKSKQCYYLPMQIIARLYVYDRVPPFLGKLNYDSLFHRCLTFSYCEVYSKQLRMASFIISLRSKHKIYIYKYKGVFDLTCISFVCHFVLLMSRQFYSVSSTYFIEFKLFDFHEYYNGHLDSVLNVQKLR